MPLKTDSIEEPNLNLTPLIDVVFNLLMFLMVATRFASEDADREFDVKLATAANARPLTALPDELVITVGSNGRILLNGKERTLAQLEADLVEAKKNYAERGVQIRGDGEGRYQNIVDVLATCHRAKINAVSLPVRLKTEERR